MKDSYIFSFLLLANAGLHAMESRQCILSGSIEEYVHGCFKDEKWNINEILEKSKFVTGSEAAAQKAIQAYRDKNGNTITHLLVMHRQPNSLFTCAQKKLISTIKNNDRLTPYNLACNNLSDYVKSPEFKKSYLADLSTEEKCCYTILVNYEKYLRRTIICCCSCRTRFKYCCKQHDLNEWL